MLIGTGAPRLSARAAAVVHLADGAAVEGVVISAPVGVAVLGRGVRDVRLKQVTVAGSHGAGILLEDVVGAALDEVTVEHTGGHGISGLRVRDLVLTGCRVRDAGDGDGDDAIHLEEPGGEVRLAGGRFAGAREDLLDVKIDRGELRLTVAGTEMAATAPPPTGNDAVLLRVGGTARLVLEITGSSFEAITGNAVDAASESTAGAAALVVRVAGSTFRDSQGSALAVSAHGQGAVAFVAEDNVFATLRAAAFQLAADDAGRLDGRIAGSDMVALGAGGVALFADEQTAVRLLVEDNALAGSGGDGLVVWASGGARVDLTLAGAWRLEEVAGAGVAAEAADGARLCVDVGGVEIAARPPLRLVRGGEAELLVAGLAGAAGEAAELEGGPFATAEGCERPSFNGTAGTAR